MDDEEDSSGVCKPIQTEHSTEVEKLVDVDVFMSSNELEAVPEVHDLQLIGDSPVVVAKDDSQPIGGSSFVPEIDDSQLVGDSSVVEKLDDSKIVGESTEVAQMDDSKVIGEDSTVAEEMGGSKLVGDSKVMEGMNDSRIVRESLVVAEMGDSKVVEDSLVVAEMSDSKVVVDSMVVAEMGDSKIVEDSLVVENMEDSKVVKDSMVVAEIDNSKLVENPPVVTEVDNSKLVEDSPVVAEMEDAKLVGDSPVVAEMDDSKLVGNSLVVAEKDDSKQVGSSLVDAEMDDSKLVGSSSVVAEMDDSEVVGGSPVLTEMDDSEIVEGSPVVADEPSVVVDEGTPIEEAVEEMDTEAEVAETSSRGGRKRKRGRVAPKVLPRTPSKKKMEEDVCFICFDGGNLVLCDRRGCPKAYHPACVNRDEAFFRSKGRWNCGWHICSNCEKAAQYMCYTCTYSLCKGCIKEAEFSCVRGNKGFCQTCMRTVLLVEKDGQGNRETTGVDFDDKNSWEYLFKDYWIDLKGKLSLTLDELVQARKPGKGSGVVPRKEDSSDELYNANNDHGSNTDSSSGHHEVSSSKKRKVKRRPKASTKEEVTSAVAMATSGDGTSAMGDTEWASKELLDFVAHMKNGDKSVLSQFDVQALLLDYIKQNDLRDPRRKSQIVCDSRLERLFGKARVGHFEMLKLLELHFILKEDTQADAIQGGIVDAEANQLDAEGTSEALTKAGTRRKSRKKVGKGPQTNLDDYAAIDVHNINLIYLRRNLMEDLLKDMDTFHDKVVGSFVRIRISGAGQKQDMYRLVQVVGTGKAAEPYKTGKTTADVTLEILNLNKTEVIAIDIISNQDFSEDECKRLRQSIKCGLISRLTVGDIQEKAIALQAVRVNDWLEAETLRISHLRDRASEKGRRKELRECVEKLQLLNKPEERFRRLQEIPEVHADPNMDPSYESEDEEAEQDDKRRENYMRPRDSGFSRKGRDPISPGKGGSALSDSWGGARKTSSTTWEPSRNMSTKGSLDKRGSTTGAEQMNETSWNQGRETHQSSSWDKSRNQTAASDLDSDAWVDQTAGRSPATEAAVSSLSTDATASSSINETEKIWHYKDPSGKIQGPFSMVQLRKWSTTGYFPNDLRIWKATERQEDSISLSDALSGKLQKQSILDISNNWNDGGGTNNSSTWTEKGQVAGSWGSNPKDSNAPANGNSELGKHGGSVSSGWTASPAQLKVVQAVTSLLGWDSSKDANDWSGQSQVHSISVPPSVGERIDFANPPTPTPGPSGGGWTGGQRAVAEWGGHSPTPAKSAVGEWNSGVSVSGQHIRDDNVTSSSELASRNNVDLGAVNLIQGSMTDPRNGGMLSSLDATANPSASSWTPLGNGFKPSEWGPPAQKQEQPFSSPTPAVPMQTPSSGHNSAASFNTADQAGNYPNPGLSPLGNWSGTPNTPSASGSAMSITPNTNNSLESIEANNRTPPISGNPWGTVPNVQPPVQATPTPWGQTSENPYVGRGPPQGNSNMGHGGPAQGNMNTGWVAVPQVSNTAGQGTMNSAGWVAVPQVNTGTQGTMNNAGWGTVPQVNSIAGQATMNTTGWGAVPQGTVNNTGWVAVPQGTMNNTGWGAVPQGNSSVGQGATNNPGWGAPPPVGNTNTWGNQQEQDGNRYSGQRDRGYRGGGDSNRGSSGGGGGGGRSSWNNRQSSISSRGGSGGGGSSRGPPPPPPNGQRGVCRFHESGRCRKGADCDYLHP